MEHEQRCDATGDQGYNTSCGNSDVRSDCCSLFPNAMTMDAAKAKPAKASAKKLTPKLAKAKIVKARIVVAKAAKAKDVKTKADKANPNVAKLEKAKARKELKEKKIAEKKAATSGEPKKPSKKALAIAANLHCRQVFVGNLPASAGEKELMEMLKAKKFDSAVRSIRVLRSSKGGKKAKKDDKGKVIPRSRGAAFIRLKCKTARDAILKEKDWQVEGKTLRLEMAGIKKRHVARMEAQAAAVNKKLALREEGIKKHKVTMYNNLLKNKKHERNLHLKLRRATSKKGNKTAVEKRRIVNIRQKLRAKKAKTIVRSAERKKLYGIKARKAMVRMSRK
ncbi:RNA recognition motif domain [Trinorchestia longiramus]|nr:RNA recognition motif domain [Trinorchestia longiramus]